MLVIVDQRGRVLKNWAPPMPYHARSADWGIWRAACHRWRFATSRPRTTDDTVARLEVLRVCHAEGSLRPCLDDGIGCRADAYVQASGLALTFYPGAARGL